MNIKNSSQKTLDNLILTIDHDQILSVNTAFDFLLSGSNDLGEETYSIMGCY
jgi:hypothetical protein